MVDLLSRPIPGQSLTSPPGGAPWEHPPRFTDPDEALNYLFDKLTSNKREATKLVLLLKHGASAESIARTLLMAGFMQGLWTPDVSLLIGKTLAYIIASIGKRAGVNVKMRNPDDDYDKFLSQFVGKGETESAPAPDESKMFAGLQ
jgi:hypothetical protein